MSHKRVVIKRGKTYGPYLYESYRDEHGSVKKRYLGKVKEDGLRVVEQKSYRGLFIFFAILSMVLLALLFVKFDMTGNVAFSGESVYVSGESIVGQVQVALQQSEFIPASTLVTINNSGEVIFYNLSDLVSDEFVEGL